MIPGMVTISAFFVSPQHGNPLCKGMDYFVRVCKSRSWEQPIPCRFAFTHDKTGVRFYLRPYEVSAQKE